ncbi:MAG TPA: tetratricopeptide repeat protein [Kofleriaceae bacterium]|nr:tetratricopeptide repeat protein [Kofleriaceae bacterium]
MRSGRWPHVLSLIAATALAQPSDTAAPTPTPATAPESLDVPDWKAGPSKVAVTPFENHVTNGKSLEWMVAETPFEIAEKSENVLGLDAVNPPLYVPGERVPADPDTVADFGHKMGAEYVVTGWYDRIREQLRIAVLVWKVDKGPNAKLAGESQKLGAPDDYHKILGEAMGDAWSKAGVGVDLARSEQLQRPLAKDTYPVFMMGRGLGHFSGALAAMNAIYGTGSGSGATGPDYESAKHDLERAVFLDPKLAEAQRLLGELYMQTAAGDPKLISKATGKFTYAADLAPDDVSSLRAAAFAMARAGKSEVALDMFKKIVTKHPWDLDARYELGAALWHVGEAKSAEHQLEQVTAHQPDHLQARRVLVLIHSSRNDTPKLISELEAIQQRAPNDLEIKGDLATAYGAVGKWPKAIAELEAIATARPNDLALLVRIGHAYRKNNQTDKALEWYARASKVEPDSSYPGYAAAQAQFDAGKLDEAFRAYTLIQKFTVDRGAAEHAMGVIAMLQGKTDQAAWNLRQAVRTEPRSLATRRAVIAAEINRKDAAAALQQAEPALVGWPNDGTLHYLAGVAHALAGETDEARDELNKALQLQPDLAAAKSGLSALAAGTTPTLEFQPELVRPWGDGDALQVVIDDYARVEQAMIAARADYQKAFLALLGAVGQGPKARVKPGSVKVCPAGQIAPDWDAAQKALQRYTRLGVELESSWRFIARHDEIGMTASLLPNSRTAVAGARKSYKLALADVAELRAEWTRGVTPELRTAGCNDKLLAAALKDPARYKMIAEDKPDQLPPQLAPRAKPRSTFFVDNTRCPDPVDVWIDGSHVGQVAPGRRSALVSDGGERTLCLLTPGGAQCGDRGTVRQVYLHDGWSTTLYCPK